MDAFSEVLSGVKLKGALFFSAEFSAPWAIATPASKALASALAPGDTSPRWRSPAPSSACSARRPHGIGASPVINAVAVLRLPSDASTSAAVR